MKPHDDIVADLARQIRARPDGLPLSLKRERGRSNVTRHPTYKEKSHLLDVSGLNRVLSIGDDLAICEPLVTMEQLVDATLPHGLIPQVVPEFKEITVGGAINGAALESSSFRYGLFSDTCAWIDVLLGNGESLRVSPEQHADLFFGMVGAYGTLAIVTRVAVRLIPAKLAVKLTTRRFSNKQAFLESLKPSENPFLEGLAFGPNDYATITATFSEATPKKQRWYSPWYIQRIPKTMHIKDYLFRLDQGAFWMGRFVLHPLLFLSYLIKFALNPNIDLFKKAGRSYPGALFRTLFGTRMTTKKLYKGLHAMPSNLVESSFVIQDWFMPQDQAASFLDHLEENHAIYPLWFCPSKKQAGEQIFSPGYLSESYCINFGTYGISLMDDGRLATRDLEARVQALGGRKALYSHSYYDEETFWSIYDRAAYEHLRAKYHADGALIPLTDKVLTRGH